MYWDEFFNLNFIYITLFWHLKVSKFNTYDAIKHYSLSFDLIKKKSISPLPGNYCESVIPDPIPNSAVKPFSANGTLS